MRRTTRPYACRSRPVNPGASGEQGEVRLAVAAQDVDVDLHPADLPRLGQHARLRLHDLGREHAATRPHPRLAAQPLEVARELLDRVDRAHALDLDGDPVLVGVPAHEVDRPDVGRPLAAHEPQPLTAPLGRLGEQFLKLALDAVLLERGRLAHVVRHVGDDLDQPDVEPVLALQLADDDRLGVLLDHGRRGHPVLRLVAAGVGVHHHRPVGLDHEQPQRLREDGVQAARIADLAAGDDQAHRRRDASRATGQSAYLTVMSTQIEPTRRQPTSREQGILLVVGMLALMWVLEIVDQVTSADLDQYGIRPHDADGLTGIATAPFLHAGFGHLIGNTVPFLVLGVAIALSGLARVAAATAIVALVAGLGTWIFASSGTDHIGASGIVFGYAAYLIARGFFSRNLLHLGVGVLVIAVYGTTLLFGLVPTDGISWQGHLFGAVGGVVAARLLDSREARRKPRDESLAGLPAVRAE